MSNIATWYGVRWYQTPVHSGDPGSINCPCDVPVTFLTRLRARACGLYASTKYTSLEDLLKPVQTLEYSKLNPILEKLYVALGKEVACEVVGT